MKTIMFALGFLFSAITVYGDTVDYWHVMYNKNVIARLNSTSDIFTLNLANYKIKKEDHLTVKFGDDTPCIKCRSALFVIDERKNKVAYATTDKFWGALSLSTYNLLSSAKKFKSRMLSFYYIERDVEKINTKVLLFKMKV